MDTTIFDIDKPAPTKKAIDESLDKTRFEMKAELRHFTLIYTLFLLFFGFLLFMKQFIEYGYGLQNVDFTSLFAISLMAIEVLLILNSLFRQYIKKHIYRGIITKMLLFRVIRSVATVSFFLVMSVNFAAYSGDSSNQESVFGLFCSFPGAYSVYLLSIFILRVVDKLFELIAEFFLPSSKEDCLPIEGYLISPEIKAYHQSVVEQGRAFVKGDVKAMAKKYNDINENKLIDEACKNVYEIGEVTK